MRRRPQPGPSGTFVLAILCGLLLVSTAIAQDADRDPAVGPGSDVAEGPGSAAELPGPAAPDSGQASGQAAEDDGASPPASAEDHAASPPSVPPEADVPATPAAAPGSASGPASGAAPTAAAEAPAPPPPARGQRTEPGDDADPMDPHPASGNIEFTPGSGLRITSDDGEFAFRISSRIQLRWTVVDVPGYAAEHEITIRRARVKFDGHLFGPHIRFKLELAFSPADLGVKDNLDPEYGNPTRSPLLSFFVDLRYLRDFELRFGQYKIASNRQRVISSANLQLVDRSILNSEFTLDRDVGFHVGSRDLGGLGLFTYNLGLYSGRGRDSRGFGDFNMMYLAHVGVTPMGSFEDFVEGDFDRGPPRLAIGTTYAFVDRGARNRGPIGSPPADGGTTTSHHYFADLMFKWEGLSVLSEFAWRDGSRTPGGNLDDLGVPIPVTPPRDGIGFNVQAGYILPWLPLEVEARYALVDGLENSSLGDRQELTGGISYYVMEHAYKVQADYSRLWLADGVDDGSNRVRVQLQLSL